MKARLIRTLVERPMGNLSPSTTRRKAVPDCTWFSVKEDTRAPSLVRAMYTAVLLKVGDMVTWEVVMKAKSGMLISAGPTEKFRGSR